MGSIQYNMGSPLGSRCALRTFSGIFGLRMVLGMVQLVFDAHP